MHEIERFGNTYRIIPLSARAQLLVSIRLGNLVASPLLACLTKPGADINATVLLAVAHLLERAEETQVIELLDTLSSCVYLKDATVAVSIEDFESEIQNYFLLAFESLKYQFRNFIKVLPKNISA